MPRYTAPAASNAAAFSSAAQAAGGMIPFGGSSAFWYGFTEPWWSMTKSDSSRYEVTGSVADAKSERPDGIGSKTKLNRAFLATFSNS
jgi:hypothetical protein